MDALPDHLTGVPDSTGGREPLARFGSASTGKIGMWVFLATDAMGFGGLLLAHAVLRVRSRSWPAPAERYDRPLAIALTFVLLISGATMSAAVAAARTGKHGLARLLTVLTALGGLAFLAGQAVEYHALVMIRHVALLSDHAAATFTVTTAYHGLHVLVGVVLLAAIASKREIWRHSGAVRPGAGNAHRPADTAGVLEVVSLYWQFVDVVWIVLFTVLYLLPPVTGG